ncbi:MAG TPA: DUF1987 domain-containing protein [Cyclobacteriaceae bacterium]|jgi:hypothetical protein|nr:DUF1987 domain-containing protein [Cyclobacteriaceae bacterium]
MDILSIESTDETPRVLLDKASGVFEISGRSLPEDSPEFYNPVLQWIDDYKKDPNPTTEFLFKLEYSNTASSKLIQDVMLALEKVKNTKIVWYYESEDEDMEQAGREFAELVNVPFEFKTY